MLKFLAKIAKFCCIGKGRKINRYCNQFGIRSKESRPTGVKNMDVLSLTIILAISTKHVQVATILHSVACMTPLLPRACRATFASRWLLPFHDFLHFVLHFHPFPLHGCRSWALYLQGLRTYVWRSWEIWYLHKSYMIMIAHWTLHLQDHKLRPEGPLQSNCSVAPQTLTTSETQPSNVKPLDVNWSVLRA